MSNHPFSALALPVAAIAALVLLGVYPPLKCSPPQSLALNTNDYPEYPATADSQCRKWLTREYQYYGKCQKAMRLPGNMREEIVRRQQLRTAAQEYNRLAASCNDGAFTPRLPRHLPE